MNSHVYKNPETYSQNNSLQYNFALSVLSKVKLNSNARVLDLGCGDGKITKKIAEIVELGIVIGTDISHEMINHAAKKYEAQINLGFMQMDASKNKFINQFDLITSFNALHWVKNQDQALKGIAVAAAEDAKVVLLLSHKKSIYHLALDSVCGSGKWQEYFKNYVNPRSFFEIENYKEMLLKAGLEVSSISEEEMTYYFDSENDLKAFFNSSMANIKEIPTDKKEDFLNDFAAEFFKQLGQLTFSKIPVSFWCLVVKAFKPALQSQLSQDSRPSIFSKL